MITHLAFSLLLSAADLAGDSPLIDAWLTTKAHLTLATHEVESRRIRVDTHHGVVTLFGSVPTSEDRQKAEQLVAALKHVTRVDNQLELVAAKVAKVIDAVDDVIAQDAKAALQKERSLAGTKVSVGSVSAGIVTLTGTANDIAEHATAVDVVQRVPGVRRIATRVEVLNDAPVTTFYYPTKGREPTSHQQDLLLTNEVRERFLADADVPVFDVSIDTVDSEVTLGGTVPTRTAREAAEKAAKQVPGVSRVDNFIVVDPGKVKEPEQKLTDKAIAGQVRKLLAAERASDIGVDVKNGTVKLSGRVRSEDKRVFLGYLTRASTSAKAVKNEITVSKAP